jgi:hypothetical protein
MNPERDNIYREQRWHPLPTQTDLARQRYYRELAENTRANLHQISKKKACADANFVLECAILRGAIKEMKRGEAKLSLL